LGTKNAKNQKPQKVRSEQQPSQPVKKRQVWPSKIQKQYTVDIEYYENTPQLAKVNE